MAKIEVLRGFSAIFSSEQAESLEVYILVLVEEFAVVEVGGAPRGEDRRGSDGVSSNHRLVSVTEPFQEKYFVSPPSLGNLECWEPSDHLS